MHGRTGAMILTLAACLSAGLLVHCTYEELDAGNPYSTRASRLGSGTFEEVTSFGDNPGDLKMFRYIPPDMPDNAPLVVAFHACSQNASVYRNAGWETLADQYRFYILYPEQKASNNAMFCFNWAGEYSDPTNLRRGEGENQSVVEMIDQMTEDYSIDEDRIFATGHSGGGAQVALMLATWPDVFAGGAMIAGIPYHCTTQYNEVVACLNPGHNFTPDQWGDYVREAYDTYFGPYPRVSLWHGTTDPIVNPQNTRELLEQWTNVHGIDDAADVEDTVAGYPHRLYQDGSGDTRVEVYELTGQGHGTFIDPDNGCGTAGAFFLDANICSAYYIGLFFGIVSEEEQPDEPTPDETPDAGPDASPDATPDAGTPDSSTDQGGPVTPDTGSDTGTGPDNDGTPTGSDTGSCPVCNGSERTCGRGCSVIDPVGARSLALGVLLLSLAGLCSRTRTSRRRRGGLR